MSNKVNIITSFFHPGCIVKMVDINNECKNPSDLDSQTKRQKSNTSGGAKYTERVCFCSDILTFATHCLSLHNMCTLTKVHTIIKLKAIICQVPSSWGDVIKTQTNTVSAAQRNLIPAK